MIVLTITVPLILVGALIYVLTNPEKAERIAGWIWRLISGLFRFGDRKAVAYSVQGDINSARSDLAQSIPEGLLASKLKVEWADVEKAEAVMRDGEVVVFMGRSRDREANLANAVMAYLPKAIVPRARRYVDRETMKAADLVLARTILAHGKMPMGAIEVFFENHLDPALDEREGLKPRLRQVDAIDMHGWLTRVMLNEYQILGDRLYPGECDEDCLKDARSFCTWLSKLAEREPGDTTWPLKYQGRYLSAGIVFVAQRDRIAREGLTPYRKRAKRLIYREKCDAVYLMARDNNIDSVWDLCSELESDGLVESTAIWEYPLRADFAARAQLDRSRGIIVMLRRRRVGDQPAVDDDDVAASEDLEVFDYETEAETLNRAATDEDVEEIESAADGA